MDIQRYINQKEIIYDLLIKFIDNKGDSDQYFNNLNKEIKTQNIQKERTEFKALLSILKIYQIIIIDLWCSLTKH